MAKQFDTMTKEIILVATEATKISLPMHPAIVSRRARTHPPPQIQDKNVQVNKQHHHHKEIIFHDVVVRSVLL
jgi:hypothetical protein